MASKSKRDNFYFIPHELGHAASYTNIGYAYYWQRRGEGQKEGSVITVLAARKKCWFGDTDMAFMFGGATTSFTQNLCLWKDAPAVVNIMTCLCSATQEENQARETTPLMHANQCPVSYFEK